MRTFCVCTISPPPPPSTRPSSYILLLALLIVVQRIDDYLSIDVYKHSKITRNFFHFFFWLFSEGYFFFGSSANPFLNFGFWLMLVFRHFEKLLRNDRSDITNEEMMAICIVDDGLVGEKIVKYRNFLPSFISVS